MADIFLFGRDFERSGSASPEEVPSSQPPPTYLDVVSGRVGSRLVIGRVGTNPAIISNASDSPSIDSDMPH